MSARIVVAYALTGADLDPSHVTAQTGLQPSKTWHKGDLIDPRAINRYKISGWRMASRLPEASELDDQIEDVLAQLSPAFDLVADLGARYSAEFACAIYLTPDSIPVLHVDKDTVQGVGKLNAALDLDVYVLPGKDKRH